MDSALDAAVIAQGDFTGDKLLGGTGDGRDRRERPVRRPARHFRRDSSDEGCAGCPPNWSLP